MSSQYSLGPQKWNGGGTVDCRLWHHPVAAHVSTCAQKRCTMAVAGADGQDRQPPQVTVNKPAITGMTRSIESVVLQPSDDT